MLLSRFFPTPFRLLAAGLVVLAGVSLAQAGQHKIPCRCCSSPEVFHSDFFGYYRTCWRPWPGGQPPCPVIGVVISEAPATVEAAPVQSPEKLPSPKPEPPAKK
jgi:hypothetical protein